MSENIDRLQREIFKGSQLEWKASQKLGTAFRFVETGNAWYTNRVGTDVIYVQPKSPANAMAYCFKDHTPILMKNQQVTGWAEDGPGPCAGTEVTTRQVRYCSKCEAVPKTTDVAVVSE